jgi:prepilin-type N-terminal cleavage/methylation domain-containing protein
LFYHNSKPNQSGFTITELTIVIVLISIVGIVFFTVTNNSINQYLSLQKDSVQFGDLALHSQKIAGVLRGITEISIADGNEITCYAYFAPNDTYVSLVNYYLNDTNTKLLADVTPMTANPPTGTPITDETITHTIIDKYAYSEENDIFEYYDASGNAIESPVSNLNIIKGIQVNLTVPSEGPIDNSSSTISTMVSLRNRKTNL